jgi:hypothetical protein
METNEFKRQKQELEEVRNESFKQGVWKGKQELWDDINKAFQGDLLANYPKTLGLIKKRHNLK